MIYFPNYERQKYIQKLNLNFMSIFLNLQISVEVNQWN